MRARCLTSLRWWPRDTHRYFYTTKKNPSSIQRKLQFRKVSRSERSRRRLRGAGADAAAVLRAQFDPIVRQHVMFSEVRISRTKPR